MGTLTEGSKKERIFPINPRVASFLPLVEADSSFVSGPMGPILADGEEKGYAIAEIDFNDLIRRPWLSCNSWGSPYEYYMCERRAELYDKIGENMFPGDNG